MRSERATPAANVIYSSEVKFGYEGKPGWKFLHLIEGRRYTVAEAHARLPQIEYAVLAARLASHAEHTWAELGQSEHERRSVAGKRRAARYRERKNKAAQRRAQMIAEYEASKHGP